MKVLLINPPSPYLDNDAAYPPMGLMYVAASLEKLNCEVEILDLAGTADWQNKITGIDSDYNLIGLTCVTPNVGMVSCITRMLPASIPVMVGGAHPTFTGCVPRSDFIVVEEAEGILPQVVSDLKQNCLQRKYVGGIPNISVIPKPARHLVDLHRYSPGGGAATPVYTSRGCVYSCKFCSKIAGCKYREFPIDRVVEEINDCKALGFDNIVFGDDNLGINPARLYNLLEAIKPLDISFRLNMDTRHPRKYIFAKSAQVGCKEISFGVESGSQKMLIAMNKQSSVLLNEESIYYTQQYRMKAKAYFMVNFPGETEETVNETLRFAKRARPNKWLLSSFAPLPGSYVYNHPQEFGITHMSKNWEDYYLVGKNGAFSPCFETNYLTYEKQIELHEMMYNGLKEILG